MNGKHLEELLQKLEDYEDRQEVALSTLNNIIGYTYKGTKIDIDIIYSFLEYNIESKLELIEKEKEEAVLEDLHNDNCSR